MWGAQTWGDTPWAEEAKSGSSGTAAGTSTATATPAYRGTAAGVSTAAATSPVIATRLYLTNVDHGMTGTFPEGEQSVNTVTSADAVAALKAMRRTPGSGMVANACSRDSVDGNGTSYNLVNFSVSPPLNGNQTVGGTTFTLNYGYHANIGASNVSAALNSVAIYVWRPSTGAIVGFLVNVRDLSSSAGESTETTNVINHLSNLAATSAVSALSGDVIVVEVWGDAVYNDAA